MTRRSFRREHCRSSGRDVTSAFDLFLVVESRRPVTQGTESSWQSVSASSFRGVSQEQFDAAHDQINPDRSSPPGMLFHTSGPIDGGWGIIDFWESRADFDGFLEGRIQPGIAASEVQMQGPPDIKEFPVHEIIHP